MTERQFITYDVTVDGTPAIEVARDMGDSTVARTVVMREDARTGKMKNIQVTLSATPATITTITLPAGTLGVRLYPTADIRYAISEATAVLATSSATTVAAAAFSVGNTAKANTLETRRIAPTQTDGVTAQTLQMQSPTASVVVTVEVF